MRIVYAHTVDSLYRAVRAHVTPALDAELRAVGVALDEKPKDLPQETWAKVLAACVKHLYPRLSVDEGYWRLGETLMNSYESTIMGKALFAMMKMLAPTRVLKRVTANLRNANNFSEGTAKELGPTHYEVWTNECHGNPNYLGAVVFGALHRSGCKDLKVKVLTFDGHAATFDIAWS